MARILVPIDGSPADDHALEVACNAAGDTGDDVQAVYVVRVPSQLPISAYLPGEHARADEAFERAHAIAERYGACLTPVLVEARNVGMAIVAAAQECDCIMIGQPTRRGIYRRFLLNRTLRYVLKHAPSQVLIVYAPPAGQMLAAPQHFLLSQGAPVEHVPDAERMPDNVYTLPGHSTAIANSRSR